jgi:hypothetical protein
MVVAIAAIKRTGMSLGKSDTRIVSCIIGPVQAVAVGSSKRGTN